MSIYYQKRVDYINHWPDVELFEAERIYTERCDPFIKEHGCQPFMPAKVWYSTETNYNLLLSRVIESLEEMPYKPHKAFVSAFTGFDNYSRFCQAETVIAKRIKLIISDLNDLSSRELAVQQMMKELFEAIPMQTTQYLYKQIFEDYSISRSRKVYHRLTTNGNNSDNAERKNLLDKIYGKYGYDTANPQSIREAGALLRIVFKKDSIIINTETIPVSTETKLHLLISGIHYSLRNNSEHGSSIAITKSSKTNLKRYALNYYAFMSMYAVNMLLAISKDVNAASSQMYQELHRCVSGNIDNMKQLFGSNLQ